MIGGEVEHDAIMEVFIHVMIISIQDILVPHKWENCFAV